MAHSVDPDAPTRTHAEGVAALLDRYEILGVIGQGGMGTVYKGYHLTLKRFVAIKILRIDQIRSPAVVARFLREMQAVGQMDHPNVVRAADGGEKNGLFYLVMEFLEGKNLSELVDRRDGLGPADACELVRQAALGLDYIHQKLVHRDVKPSNLLLTPAGVVKILDLGLARLHEADPGDKERTPEGCAVGTFDYMAPEQAAGSGVVDGRTDIYSLGCTLFKLLTGRAPFSGPDYDSVARKLYAHGHVPLTALAAFQAVPERARPVLLRMTAKDPADRYATAGEAARDLAPLAAGSEPARLLAGSGGGDAALEPLPVPPPEELSRLTGPLTATRPNVPDTAAPAAAARPSAGRLVWMAGALAACLLATAWYLLPRQPPRPQPPRQDAPADTALPDEVRLPPPPGPLVALDSLPRLNWHNLLGPGEPPTLIGYREGDGQTTGRWMPGRQQIEISPMDTVLIQLGADDRQRPGFTLEVLLNQHPWSGVVGLFWGYQEEDAKAKAAHQPGRPFARCQTLLLFRGQRPNGGAAQFFVYRSAVRLRYNADGGLTLGQEDWSQDFLPPFGGEQLFQIVVEGGRLKSARFGDVDLTNAHQPDANKKFQPADYGGAFGVITRTANVTVRQPRVMPHADH